MRNQDAKSRGKRQAWFEPLLVSPLRCHLLGGTLSLVLLIAIIWICRNADSFAHDHQHSPQELEQAAQLLADADQLRQQYAESLLLSKQNDHRLNAIRSWLPTSIDWQSTTRRIEKTAAQANVELKLLDKGETHIGSRIGVGQMTCKVRGSYAGLCQLLHRLSNEEKPVWCHWVKIERAPSLLDQAVECDATISLRLPFAAEQTIAGKLMPAEIPDAT